MSGFDIRRASVGLGNLPGVGTGGVVSQMGRFQGAGYTHPFLRLASDVDETHKQGMQALDRLIDFQTENAFNEMKAAYEQADTEAILAIKELDDVKLSDFNPEDYVGDMKDAEQTILKDDRWKSAHPKAKQLFNRFAEQKRASGFAQVGGWKIGATERRNEASRQVSRTASENAYLANQTQENRTTYLRAVEQEAVRRFKPDSKEFGDYVGLTMQGLDDKALAQNIGNATDDDALDRLAEDIPADDKRRQGIFKEQIANRRQELKREAAARLYDSWVAFDKELTALPPVSGNEAQQAQGYAERVARITQFLQSEPDLKYATPDIYRKLEKEKTYYEALTQTPATQAYTCTDSQNKEEVARLENGLKLHGFIVESRDEKTGAIVSRAYTPYDTQGLHEEISKSRRAGLISKNQADELTAKIRDEQLDARAQDFLGWAMSELQKETPNAISYNAAQDRYELKDSLARTEKSEFDRATGERWYNRDEAVLYGEMVDAVNITLAEYNRDRKMTLEQMQESLKKRLDPIGYRMQVEKLKRKTAQIDGAPTEPSARMWFRAGGAVYHDPNEIQPVVDGKAIVEEKRRQDEEARQEARARRPWAYEMDM